MKRGLFIGRFQPFHLGHLKDIEDALKEVDELLIGIGSSNEERTKDNPFTINERVKMADSALLKKGITRYSIFPIPDFNDDDKWVQHIEKNLPKFDVVYTGNKWTDGCFKKFGYNVKRVNMLEGISSTIIRDMIAEGKEWKKLVPKEVFDFISKIKGVERVKGTFKK